MARGIQPRVQPDREPLALRIAPDRREELITRAAVPFGFTLIGFGAVQVAPQSFDVWSEMSAPDTVRSTLFW